MSKATLSDWAWVEVMVFQSLLGYTTAQVIAFGLSERTDDWVVTFFVRGEIDDELRADLVEMPGMAMEALLGGSEFVSEAALRPIFTKIVNVEHSLTYDYLSQEVDRPLFWLRD